MMERQSYKSVETIPATPKEGFAGRIRNKLKNLLFVAGVGSTTLANTGCREGFSVEIVNTKAGSQGPTEKQIETIDSAMNILELDHHIINGTTHMDRGVMTLIFTRPEIEYSSATTIRNTRCNKVATVYDQEENLFSCDEDDEDCHDFDVITAAHEIGHLAGLGHSCECYENECPDELGSFIECPIDNEEVCQDMIEQGCILCEDLVEAGAKEGSFKVCTDKHNDDLMNGAYTGAYSTALTKKERKKIKRTMRNFDWCIGGR